jgi:hypothetical protein
MTTTITDILRTNTFESKGWEIDFSDLQYPDKLDQFKYSSAEIIESNDKKYCCLFYLIDEYRMLCYTGLVAIYTNKSAPELIFNSRHWFDYQFSETVYYCGNYMVLRKNEMYFEQSKQVFSPFIVINLESKEFTIIDFDFTSIYYGVEYLEKNRLKLKLNNPNDLTSLRVNVENKDGYIIDLTEISFLPFNQLDNALKQYCDRKKPATNNTLPKAGRTWWQKLFGSV